MGSDSLGARLGASALEDDHRLRTRRATQYIEEAASVLHAFHVGRDYLRLGVLGQVIQEVGFVQVGGVAVAQHFAESDATRRCQVDYLGAVTPALRDGGNRPRLRREPRLEGQALLWVVHAHTIRANQPDAGSPGSTQQFVLQQYPLLASRLLHPGCVEVDDLHALPGALVDQLERPCGRDGGDDVVHRPGHVLHRGKARYTLYLLRVGVYWVQGALEGVAQHEAKEVVALVGACGCPHYRDGAGMENEVQFNAHNSHLPMEYAEEFDVLLRRAWSNGRQGRQPLRVPDVVSCLADSALYSLERLAQA